MQYLFGDKTSIAFLPYYEIEFEGQSGEYEMTFTYDSYNYNWGPLFGYKTTYKKPRIQTQYYGNDVFHKKTL